MEQDTSINTYPYLPQETFFSCFDTTLVAKNPAFIQPDRNERLKTAVESIQIGRRIQDALKQQGRTVAWLARQLRLPHLAYGIVPDRFASFGLRMEPSLRYSFLS